VLLSARLLLFFIIAAWMKHVSKLPQEHKQQQQVAAAGRQS
jgi:hypothetical protein